MSRMGLNGRSDMKPCERLAPSSAKVCQFAFVALFCYENFGHRNMTVGSKPGFSQLKEAVSAYCLTRAIRRFR
jgi:hypothetical protein